MVSRFWKASGKPLAPSRNIVLDTTYTYVPTITAPVLTRTSTAGASPLLINTALNMTDTFAGDFLRVEVAASLTPATNGDGSYTTPAQNFLHQLTPGDIESQDINITADGFVTPSGAYSLHMRIEREDGQNSAWSNALSDTINAANAMASLGWNSADKGNVTLTGTKTAQTTTTSPGGVRSTETLTAKLYFEFLVIGYAAGHTWELGVANTTPNLTGYLATADSLFYRYDGKFETNGGVVATSGILPVAGTRYRMAIDVPNKLIWVGSMSTWFGDPVAGTGGVSYSTVPNSTGIKLVYSGDNSADGVTLYTTAATITGTVPTGFAVPLA